MFDGILFDMDGTLWDATPIIQEGWNRALALHPQPGRADVTLEEVRATMGLLRHDIERQLFPDADDDVRKRLSALQADYMMAQMEKGGAALYPAVEETLALLSQSARLFLVSNCGERYLGAFYAGHGLKKYFYADLCAGRTGRPKADNIAQVVREYGLKAPVYVGDTALDRDSAQAAGVPFLHAAYGFGKLEGVSAAATFADIPAALMGMCPP